MRIELGVESFNSKLQQIDYNNVLEKRFSDAGVKVLDSTFSTVLVSYNGNLFFVLVTQYGMKLKKVGSNDWAKIGFYKTRQNEKDRRNIIDANELANWVIGGLLG